jgi:hypothetical protein
VIYSPDHNFLLIKNVKVGGTSLEVELSKVLPDNAIVTPIVPSNPEHEPRNHSGFYNHMPYSEIMTKIDLSNVKSYVMVRNPYDMVLSHFFYISDIGKHWNNLSKNDQISMIDKYFNNEIDGPWLRSSKKLYCIDGKIVVDQILKYENNIEDEINNVLPKHNINKIKINTFEKQYRPKNVIYQDTFLTKHLYSIQDEWDWEFEKLGYNI